MRAVKGLNSPLLTSPSRGEEKTGDEGGQGTQQAPQQPPPNLPLKGGGKDRR